MKGFVFKSFKATLMVIIIVIPSLIFLTPFFYPEINEKTLMAIKCMSLALLTYMPYKILSAYVTGLKYPNRFYIYEILRISLVIALVLYYLFTSKALEPSTIFTLFAAANLIMIIAIILFLRNFEIFNFLHLNKLIDRQWDKSGLYYIALGSGYIVLSNTDILVLGYFQTSAEVGFYRLALLIAGVIVIFLSGVDSYLAPRLSEYFKKNDLNNLQKIALRNSMISSIPIIPFFLTFLFFGENIISFFFGIEYIESMKVLLILIFGASCRIIFGSVGFIINMSGKESITARILWVSCFFNLVLNLLLVPSMGIVGASIATSMSLFGAYLSQYIYIRRFIGIQPSYFLKLFN